jgi:elongation factor P--beta-lysine ligase
MNLTNILIKQNIIKEIRNYFFKQNFTEFNLPLLQKTLPLEPNIHAFTTAWKTLKTQKQLYLPTSPEANLKKILAAGCDSVFSISPAFRNIEDASPTHNPEFLMLEWYRKNTDYQQIINDVQNLIISLKNNVNTVPNHAISFKLPWPTVTMNELWQKYVGVTLKSVIHEADLNKLAATKGYTTENSTWEQLFNQIFLNEIEPHIGFNPFIITQYPSKVSPLCAPIPRNPDLAERFELYIGGMEIGNGNTENTNTKLVKQAFIDEENYRNNNKIDVPTIDASFLTALDQLNTSPIAGMGLGIDRLTMIFANVKDISEVIM